MITDVSAVARQADHLSASRTIRRSARRTEAAMSMAEGSRVLVELVIVLGSATVVTVVFQALRMPVVLGYVLAGMVIGPHVPVPLVADAELVHVLSQLGVI